jgi:hypothetical protein
MIAVKNWHRFVALTAFVCALALAGCGKKDDAPKAEGDPKPADPKPSDPKRVDPLADAVPDVVYAAEELPANASTYLEKNHAGKLIELTGTVYTSGRSYGKSYVFLRSKNGGIAISCDVPDKKPWTKVLPSQTVTLRGRMTDKLVWQIIRVSGTPPPTLAAEQVIQEKRKVRADDYLIVTGVIVKQHKDEQGNTHVFLKGNETELLECVFFYTGAAFVPLEPEQERLLHPGQRVKLLGEYLVDQLTGCVLLEPAP